MESVFEVTVNIIKAKRQNRRHPVLALKLEIVKLYQGEDLQMELDNLVAARILIKGHTINDDYYRINGQDYE